MSSFPNSLLPTPTPAEALGLPLDTAVPRLLGSLATRVEQDTTGEGPSLTLEERYAGRMLTADVQEEASQGHYLSSRTSQDAGFVVTNRFGPELDASREEGITDPVIAANVTAMESPVMQEVLMSELVGGNAGGVEINGEKYPAAAVNGYADEHGLIIAFGKDPKLVARGRGFTLKIARGRLDLSDEQNPRYVPEGRIVRVYRESDFHKEAAGTNSNLSDEAVGRIREAAQHYNEHYVKRPQ